MRSGFFRVLEDKVDFEFCFDFDFIFLLVFLIGCFNVFFACRFLEFFFECGVSEVSGVARVFFYTLFIGIDIRCLKVLLIGFAVFLF